MESVAFYTSSSNPLSVLQTQHEKNRIHYLSTIQITYSSSSDFFISENDITSFTSNNCLKSLCHFWLFLSSSSHQLSHPIESTPAKHLACIFFLSFFSPSTEINHCLSFRCWQTLLPELPTLHLSYSLSQMILTKKSSFSYATFLFITL